MRFRTIISDDTRAGLLQVILVDIDAWHGLKLSGVSMTRLESSKLETAGSMRIKEMPGLISEVINRHSIPGGPARRAVVI